MTDTCLPQNSGEVRVSRLVVDNTATGGSTSYWHFVGICSHAPGACSQGRNYGPTPNGFGAMPQPGMLESLVKEDSTPDEIAAVAADFFRAFVEHEREK